MFVIPGLIRPVIFEIDAQKEFGTMIDVSRDETTFRVENR